MNVVARRVTAAPRVLAAPHAGELHQSVQTTSLRALPPKPGHVAAALP